MPRPTPLENPMNDTNIWRTSCVGYEMIHLVERVGYPPGWAWATRQAREAWAWATREACEAREARDSVIAGQVTESLHQEAYDASYQIWRDDVSPAAATLADALREIYPTFPGDPVIRAVLYPVTEVGSLERARTIPGWRPGDWLLSAHSRAGREEHYVIYGRICMDPPDPTGWVPNQEQVADAFRRLPSCKEGTVVRTLNHVWTWTRGTLPAAQAAVARMRALTVPPPAFRDARDVLRATEVRLGRAETYGGDVVDILHAACVMHGYAGGDTAWRAEAARQDADLARSP